MSLAGELDQLETWLTAAQKSIEKIFTFEKYSPFPLEGKLILNLNLIIVFIELYWGEIDSKLSSHNEGEENILSFLQSVRR